MILLNVRTARSIWIVDSRDLNPRGIDITPLLSAVRDRYKFQIFPKPGEPVDESSKDGIVFGNGSFSGNTVVKATIFSDGIVVDTTQSTDLSEAFLADVLQFISTQFGLTYSPDMVQRKIYLSEVIVRATKNLNRLFAPVSVIAQELNTMTGLLFEPFGFGFAMDTTTSTARPTLFKFEQEAHKPFSQNRYYSSAPLRTTAHLELLNKLEELL
jgi:hypothetical protein